jgi:hypothetical protein
MVAVYTPGKPAKLRRGLFRTEAGDIGSECPRRCALWTLSTAAERQGKSAEVELLERRADSSKKGRAGKTSAVPR